VARREVQKVSLKVRPGPLTEQGKPARYYTNKGRQHEGVRWEVPGMNVRESFQSVRRQEPCKGGDKTGERVVRASGRKIPFQLKILVRVRDDGTQPLKRNDLGAVPTRG